MPLALSLPFISPVDAASLAFSPAQCQTADLFA